MEKEKLQFVDRSTLDIESIIINKNGNIEIVVAASAGKTAEEVKGIFRNKPNLAVITVLTASGTESSTHSGYTKYCGLFMPEDDKMKVILSIETDINEARITTAEAAALSAQTRAVEAETRVAAALEKVTELEAENTALKEQQTEMKEQQQATEVALTDVEIAVYELQQERIGEVNE